MITDQPQIETVSTNQESQSGSSLQDSFAAFRKVRYEKMKHAKYLKERKADERRSIEFKEELRQKFIQQCKSYFGVPYHSRYWSEGESHFNAPLYLDCCGLIRQVVYDLREDFGFSLGRWNQAYQFDICHKELRFEEMRPGDLIFYSATYYNPKLKPFPHKMVHVEVFTGGETGEQTIGARWQKGFVQYHESYQFTSKNYFDIQFHFRSLDTWLDGICRSNCVEHPWRDDRDLWVPDKFSVFADPSLADCEDAEQKEEFEGGECATQTNERKKQKSDCIKDVFVGKGNNDQLIRAYFNNKSDEFRLLDSSKTYSPKFFFKWVQTGQEIDFFSFKEGSQIVNHIPNINIFTSKVGLVNLLKNYEALMETNKERMETSSKDFFPESYQLDMMSDEIAFLTQDTDPNSIWILKPHNNNMGRGIIMIGNILGFKQEFIESKRHKLGEYTTAYLLSSKSYISVNHESDKVQQTSASGPSSCEAEETKQPLLQTQLKYQGISHHSIIQKYVKEPLLLNKRKFDIRCYALIASTNPLIVLFNKGYARVCLHEYTLEGLEDPKNRHIHLTNAAVQKSHPDYKVHKEDSIWTIEKLSGYLKEEKSYDDERQREMWDQVKAIIKHVINAGYPKLEKKKGQYELLGVDILLDQNLKPYLLEVNTNPALFLDTVSQKQVIPPMMHKTLDIVFEVNASQLQGAHEKEIQDAWRRSCNEYKPFELIIPSKEK